jgi:hypothetical protein
MLAMATYDEQMYFLADATEEEIAIAKSLLSRYKKMVVMIEGFAKNPPESEKQIKTQKQAIQCSRNIERAVNQIVDSNVRALIEYRYIKGNSRAATILRFSGWDYCDKTIDRKIIEGIESVANSLLYL